MQAGKQLILTSYLKGKKTLEFSPNLKHNWTITNNKLLFLLKGKAKNESAWMFLLFWYNRLFLGEKR